MFVRLYEYQSLEKSEQEAADVRTQDKTNLITIFQFMERNDPNGDYYSYIEDIEAGKISLTETAAVLIKILSRWKSDLHSRKNPKYATMTAFQIILAAMV